MRDPATDIKTVSMDSKWGFGLVQGGAVSYAAAVLSALGVRSCVVTGKFHTIEIPLMMHTLCVYQFLLPIKKHDSRRLFFVFCWACDEVFILD